ncbi:MAG: hypothetical protein PVH93_06190 [Nitrosopumilaceae archaeon]|jgi:hypothetical protein
MAEITYKEKQIEIKEDKDNPKLFVNGKEIEFLLEATSGTFSCQQLPYSRYSSLEDLGRALIDNFNFSEVKT